MNAILRRVIIVDLFDRPQRVEFRERVIALRSAGHTEQEVAAILNITVTAAQRAASLHRIMKEKGLVDPYVRITEPQPDCVKLKRHLHPRYRFETQGGQSGE